MSSYNDDDYPAADPIPGPIDSYHTELMEFLVDNQDMRKAAQHSLRQGLFAGGGAIAGGLLLGPVGGLVGGIAGSVLGFLQADDYDGAVQQLLKLDQAHQERLLLGVRTALIAAGASAQQFNSPQAFRSTLIELASTRSVREQVWKACLDCIE